MADTSKLKRSSKGKGLPPSIEDAPGNTQSPARDKKEATRAMQFKIPEHIAVEFDKEAMENFGFKKGSKTQMFLKLWQHYKKTC